MIEIHEGIAERLKVRSREQSGSIEQEESRIKPKLDECIISVADKIIDGKSTLSECDYVREIQALSSLVDSRAMLDR